MNTTAELYDYAAQVLAGKEFFERSTQVLDESDSQFRPCEGMMTVAQQVAHAAQTIEWFVEGATRPEGFDLDFAEHARALAEVRSLTEARHRLENAFIHAADFLRGKTPEELARPLPAGPVMGGRPTYEIIGAMVEHTAHHRGALTVYSRLLGKVPPMPYGG
ncbi:DinB family protein [Occallatibacter riparius]|uniref:DinB family protein n=1 Tax=Occallatibacter riparius TaxID=1002689 RepID=A0A9J7BXD6_9BACT|nr:DinB family protein [Occallatibacter riparius]UWZ85638.1 DinB family protein [Occallatibacter riparius]